VPEANDELDYFVRQAGSYRVIFPKNLRFGRFGNSVLSAVSDSEGPLNQSEGVTRQPIEVRRIGLASGVSAVHRQRRCEAPLDPLVPRDDPGRSLSWSRDRLVIGTGLQRGTIGPACSSDVRSLAQMPVRGRGDSHERRAAVRLAAALKDRADVRTSSRLAGGISGSALLFAEWDRVTVLYEILAKIAPLRDFHSSTILWRIKDFARSTRRQGRFRTRHQPRRRSHERVP
jgi:hypothetical protein